MSCAHLQQPKSLPAAQAIAHALKQLEGESLIKYRCVCIIMVLRNSQNCHNTAAHSRVLGMNGLSNDVYPTYTLDKIL